MRRSARQTILGWCLALIACTRVTTTENVTTPSAQVDPEKLTALTPLQLEVTQHAATEPPFKNEFWDNKRPGIYVDIVSGEPLFSSLDKFDSASGWPSFTRPLDEAAIVEHEDRSYGMQRIEVKSRIGNSHLGHLFADGPPPTGKRYCINSAAMRFIPAEQLEAAGYNRSLFAPSPASTVLKESSMLTEPTETAIATFAGGCFWCMEPPFEQLPGVRAVVSGYTGGTTVNPTYEEVSAGKTGHAESIQVTYDPKTIDYEKLLEVFWQNIDPTTINRQFADAGTHYRTAIFYHHAEQKRLAEASRAALDKSKKFDRPIVTEIAPASTFYPAENYHQDYYKKNPAHYKRYRIGSGRQGYLEKTWGEK